MRMHPAAALLASLLCWASAAAAQPPQTQAQAQSEDPAYDTQVPAPLSRAGRQLVAGQNAFAVDLYRTVRQDPGNLLLSPASISNALALAYRGAAGTTAEEMRRVMHFPGGPLDAAPSGEVARTLALSAPGRELHSANALFVRGGLPLNQAYVDDMELYYGAGLKFVDFAADPDSARRRINAWVEERTADRIRGLLGPRDVTKLTAAVLVNALYLKAAWAAPFQAKATRPGPFTRLDGRKVEVPLMHQRARFRTLSIGPVQGIALPYRGGELEMIVLLPGGHGDLPRLEGALTAESLEKWADRLAQAPELDTILTLPRFRLEWRQDLVAPLQGLGLRLTTSDDADFTGMKRVDALSGDPRDWPVKIKRVIHKSFLEADEKGSEAAAATAVVMDVVITGTVMRKPVPPVVFNADRSFLLAIRDRRTGAILFLGRLTDPSPPPPAG